MYIVHVCVQVTIGLQQCVQLGGGIVQDIHCDYINSIPDLHYVQPVLLSWPSYKDSHKDNNNIVPTQLIIPE